MLKLENIRKVFHAGTVNQKIALDGLILTLNDAELVTVIGGNGAGPSPLPIGSNSAHCFPSWIWGWKIA